MKIGFGPLLIAALVAGLIGGIAFGGGVLYGRITAPQPAQAQSTSVNAARAATVSAAVAGTPAAGRGGRGGSSFGGAGGGNAVQGAITGVNGSTLTIRTAVGTEQQVQITPQTQISMLQSAGLNDLIPGTVILVQGQASDNGPFVAGSITITAAAPNAPRPSGTPGPRPTRTAQATSTP